MMRNSGTQKEICDELFDINNGRSLCLDCHRQTDTYGYKQKLVLVELRKQNDQ